MSSASRRRLALLWVLTAALVAFAWHAGGRAEAKAETTAPVPTHPPAPR